LRQEALDKPYAVLVTCAGCNCESMTDRSEWPESRQLSILKKSRPADYDLVAYNFLVNPNAPERITEEEVKKWQ
jgi:hypothetical protein